MLIACAAALPRPCFARASRSATEEGREPHGLCRRGSAGRSEGRGLPASDDTRAMDQATCQAYIVQLHVEPDGLEELVPAGWHEDFWTCLEAAQEAMPDDGSGEYDGPVNEDFYSGP